MKNKELVLEYWDQEGCDKIVIVNEFKDNLWLIDFDHDSIKNLDIETCLMTILEDINFEAGIDIEDWFYESLVNFCKNEIEESGTEDMKPILENLESI